MMPHIDLKPSEWQLLQKLFQRYLPGIRVWAYGSRVKWRARPNSDLDLVVFAMHEHRQAVSDLRDAFEESDLPFEVDLHVWDDVPLEFRRQIEEDYLEIFPNQDVAGEWREMPFSQAVTVNPKVGLTRGATYPFVDMGAVSSSLRSAYASEQRQFDGGGSRFAVGDTLMARITPCLENGKIARFAGKPGEIAHGSTEFIVLRGRDEVSDTDYAYYLTKWEGVSGYAISQMTGTSGRQRVPSEALDHLYVPLPPLPEQRAIAHILGTLDDKIELNRRMNETLEAMARALFKSWFVDFDPVRAKMEGRDPGMPDRGGLSKDGFRTRPYADLFPDRLVNSELGPIPEGWEVVSLDEISDFFNGLALQKYPPKNDKSLPVIKIAQLRDGHTLRADLASDEIATEYIVEDGDILFSWSGSLDCVLWVGGRGALNQHLFKVIPCDYPKWFCYFWIHQHLERFRNIAAGKATTMGHIQRHHLREAKVLVPKTQIFEVLDLAIDPLFEKVFRMRCQSRTLAALRDALLPKLISGELRVKDAEKFIGRAI
ncbi:MAG: restriction endonuclease subunit S [Fimbriimonadia bacterium]|nr:restriction endonuclease subunit S [Fimbriimonadia bacterium]